MSKETRNQAQYRWAKKALKRVPLDLRVEDYTILKEAADAAGESVNGYIKVAIWKRLASGASGADDSSN